MAAEQFDYARLLNDIDAKIASLQTLRASVQVASASGALGQPIEGMELPSQALTAGRSDVLGVPADLPEGAFIGKSVPACVELYLSAVKKKKSNEEITAALRDGGVESNASNFRNTVTAALFKLKKDGTVLRFKDGWGLSSWYPAHIRASAPVGSNKRARKGKKNGQKSKAVRPVTAAPIAVPTPSKRKTGDRIIELLRTKPEREYPLAEIAKHLGIGVPIAGMVLGQFLKSGKVKMSAPGFYAIGRPQLVAAAQ
jgi:hypothetical protein